MKRLAIAGASGHGRVCAEIAELMGYEDIVFLDDDEGIKECGGHHIVGTTKDFDRYNNGDTDFFVAIGNSKDRRRIQIDIERMGGKIISLIHPDAVVSGSAEIGSGSVLMAGAVINAGTRIGKGSIVNTGSSIDHDCVVGDYCHIAVGAHICGTVNIGKNVWIGAGAIANNNINICDNTMIGSGAVVTKDIKEPGTYIGIPAGRMTREKNSKVYDV